MSRPRVNSEGQRELDKAEEQLEGFKKAVEEFNPLEDEKKPVDIDPQTKLSSKQMKESDAPYIKWTKYISRVNSEKWKTYWDEKHRAAHDRDWEYVRVIVENNEIMGSPIEMWTAEYGCDPAHYWTIPVNKPIYIPRLVARKIAKCKYHRLRVENTVTTQEAGGQFYGALVVDNVQRRLNAYPATSGSAEGF